MKQQRKFFTMIELLGAVAIIAVLGLVGFGGYTYAQNAARENATRAMLKQIEAGLKTARSKLGYYPPSGGLQNIRIVQLSDHTYTISFDGSTPSAANEFSRAFFKAADAENLLKRADSDGVLRDAWGNPILFCSPGTFNTATFDLISGGADGAFGSDNDASPAGLAIGKFKTDGEWICDDLANF